MGKVFFYCASLLLTEQTRVAKVGKTIWKMIFPGKGKVSKFLGWSGKFGKAKKVKEFEK